MNENSKTETVVFNSSYQAIIMEVVLLHRSRTEHEVFGCLSMPHMKQTHTSNSKSSSNCHLLRGAFPGFTDQHIVLTSALPQNLYIPSNKERAGL